MLPSTALKHGLKHPGRPSPTPGLETPDPGYGLTFVTGAPVSREISTVVINALGFGGFNSSVVYRRPT